MTSMMQRNGYTAWRSLRARMLVAISASVLVIIATLIWLSNDRTRHMTQAQIQHEGLLLSDTLEAAIASRAADANIASIQAYIDDLVELREKNDLEINVLFLNDTDADIVASNVPDNIEEADDEEYEATLAVLATRRPHLYVEIEDGPGDEDSESSDEDSSDEQSELRAADPTHPDYYFPPGSRMLNITTPLEHNGAEIGSINLKLSLHYMDRERARLARSSVIGLVLGCAILAALLTPFLNRKLFGPLSRLAERMYDFGTGEEIEDVAPTARRDEIGILEREFYNMVARIKSAEVIRQELERARNKEEMHELQEKLRHAQKMEALGTLAGGIAHDFNNVLTPILGYSEIVKERLNGDNVVEEELDHVIQAAGRAQDLVGQILAFSRQGQQETCALRVTPIIKETLKLLRASIPANIDIHTDIQEAPFAVLGSATHVHQIALNLVTNAWHAMIDTGGSIDVILREESVGAPRELSDAEELPAGSYLRLTIADTGHGIRPDLVERIFEPYFTTKAEGEGTGLGLAMVHSIVQEMGGTITVESEMNKGTRFDVYLPKAEETPAGAAADRGPAARRGAGKVLVLDDEEPTANLIGTMLRGLGYDCEIYTDPRLAAEQILTRRDAYDLLVSDIAMPSMTGVELAMTLAGEGIDIPIVLCSGYTGGINWRMAGSAGIHAVVGKPIAKPELANAVRNAIARSSGSAVNSFDVDDALLAAV